MKKGTIASAFVFFGIILFSIQAFAQKQPDAPSFSIKSGVYNSDQKVSITYRGKGAKIFYTIDGTEPTEKSLQYLGAFTLNKTTTVKAAAFSKNGKSGIAVLEYARLENISSIELKSLPPKEYKVKNIYEVLDGKPGSNNLKDGSWLAAEGVDLEVIVSFKEITAVSGVELNFAQNADEGIYFPDGVDIFVTPDGKSFFRAGFVAGDQLTSSEKFKVQNFDIPTRTAVTKGIKIVAKNSKSGPGSDKISKVLLNKIKFK